MVRSTKEFNTTNSFPGMKCLKSIPQYRYSGYVRVTKSGRPCMSWKDHPYGKHFPPTAFPEKSVSDAANYCRKPTFTIEPPWCYYGKKKKQREHCDLPHCDTGNFDYSNQIPSNFIP